MDIRRVSTIALPMSAYPSLEEKFDHALELMKVAINAAAELICLPETFNRYKGNTPETADEISPDEYVLEEDSPLIQPFFEMAKKNRTAVVLPLFVKGKDGHRNSAFFVNEKGRIAGREMPP